MFFSNISDHVLFGRVNFHCPCIRKVSFFVGQFSFPIPRVVPTRPELRSSHGPWTEHTRNSNDRPASSCQETRPISHIFGPIIADCCRGNIRRRISPMDDKAIKSFMLTNSDRYNRVYSRARWWFNSSVSSLFHGPLPACMTTKAKSEQVWVNSPNAAFSLNALSPAGHARHRSLCRTCRRHV